MKIGVGVYVKDSPAAVALYQEAFGLELGYHVKNPDGTFYHSELWRDGVEVIDVVEAPIACTAKPAVQLCVNLKALRTWSARLRSSPTAARWICP